MIFYGALALLFPWQVGDHTDEYLAALQSTTVTRSIDEEAWWDRAAENTQLYQVVSVEGDTLRYEARTAVGDPYDAFDLVKREGLPNRMIDRTPKGVPERRHHNTIGGTLLSEP